MKHVIFGELRKQFNLTLHEFINMVGRDMIFDTKKIHKIVNHPVHIIDEEGNLSPSAFIPFCEFGGNMSIMGTKVDHFDVPVCSSFKAKVLNDQLCYEVDPNNFTLPPNNLVQGQGLKFYVDINQDRQTATKDPAFKIYLDTLGKYHNKVFSVHLFTVTG